MNWSLYRHSFSLSVNILVLKPWKWVWMSVNLWVCYCGIYGSSLSFACSKYYVSCNRALQQEVIFPGVLLTLPLPGHKVQVNVFYFLRTSPTHRQALCQLTPSRKQRQQTSLWFSQLWNRNILALVINPFQPTLSHPEDMVPHSENSTSWSPNCKSRWQCHLLSDLELDAYFSPFGPSFLWLR